MRRMGGAGVETVFSLNKLYHTIIETNCKVVNLYYNIINIIIAKLYIAIFLKGVTILT